ncbi:MAG TPA: hypothetical protein VIX12_03370, partial [Candidatus Binataceae bacterium]
QVRLTVDGKAQTQTLKVIMDPRSPATPEILAQQLQMSSADIEAVRRARKQIAAGGESAYFRKLFKREMHTTVVMNMHRVGLLNERTSAFLRDMGIDPIVQAAA